MEFKHDPVPFIFEKGDPFTKLCVLEMVDLWNTVIGKELLLDLLKTQKKDGGFPSGIDSKHSGMKETERAANLLLRCKMPKDGLALASCMKFLLKHQTQDGGFPENPKLTIPPEMTELSNQKGVTWLTAGMVDLLRLMGQENTKACQKAINWLRRMELPEGGWGAVEEDEEIDPDSSAQITFLMKDLLGGEDTLYKRGMVLFKEHLDQMAQNAEQGFYHLKGEKHENEVYHLTHLLGQSIFTGKRGADAGYKLKDRRVKKILEGIIEIQREDGGFRPYWSKESDPLYTAIVLKIFLWVGAMKKKEIKSGVEKVIVNTA
ncbi:MAG: prenyltransferase/squalene oxidase repeat-containing protein [Candidatus Zixiibacteriota bacterium]|jgi:prenyltransferase beta subunit